MTTWSTEGVYGSLPTSRQPVPAAFRDSCLVASALLIFAIASVCLAFWPGLVYYDGAHIISNAEHGQVVDWWTGTGTYLLRAWLRLGLGISLLWLLMIVGYVAGVYQASRLVLSRVPAALFALFLTVLPPVYGQLAAFTRDNACLACSMLVVGALARLSRGDRRRHPRLLLAAACFAAVFAAVSRQNGVCVIVGLVLFMALRGKPKTGSRVILASVSACLAAGMIYGGLSFVNVAAGVRATYPGRETMVYDLAAMSLKTGTDLFPQTALAAEGAGGAARTGSARAR